MAFLDNEGAGGAASFEPLHGVDLSVAMGILARFRRHVAHHNGRLTAGAATTPWPEAATLTPQLQRAGLGHLLRIKHVAALCVSEAQGWWTATPPAFSGPAWLTDALISERLGADFPPLQEAELTCKEADAIAKAERPPPSSNLLALSLRCVRYLVLDPTAAARRALSGETLDGLEHLELKILCGLKRSMVKTAVSAALSALGARPPLLGVVLAREPAKRAAAAGRSSKAVEGPPWMRRRAAVAAELRRLGVRLLTVPAEQLGLAELVERCLKEAGVPHVLLCETGECFVTGTLDVEESRCRLSNFLAMATQCSKQHQGLSVVDSVDTYGYRYRRYNSMLRQELDLARRFFYFGDGEESGSARSFVLSPFYSDQFVSEGRCWIRKRAARYREAVDIGGEDDGVFDLWQYATDYFGLRSFPLRFSELDARRAAAEVLDLDAPCQTSSDGEAVRASANDLLFLAVPDPACVRHLQALMVDLESAASGGGTRRWRLPVLRALIPVQRGGLGEFTAEAAEFLRRLFLLASSSLDEDRGGASSTCEGDDADARAKAAVTRLVADLKPTALHALRGARRVWVVGAEIEAQLAVWFRETPLDGANKFFPLTLDERSRRAPCLETQLSKLKEILPVGAKADEDDRRARQLIELFEASKRVRKGHTTAANKPAEDDYEFCEEDDKKDEVPAPGSTAFFRQAACKRPPPPNLEATVRNMRRVLPPTEEPPPPRVLKAAAWAALSFQVADSGLLPDSSSCGGVRVALDGAAAQQEEESDDEASAPEPCCLGDPSTGIWGAAEFIACLASVEAWNSQDRRRHLEYADAFQEALPPLVVALARDWMEQRAKQTAWAARFRPFETQVQAWLSTIDWTHDVRALPPTVTAEVVDEFLEHVCQRLAATADEARRFVSRETLMSRATWEAWGALHGTASWRPKARRLPFRFLADLEARLQQGKQVGGELWNIVEICAKTGEPPHVLRPDEQAAVTKAACLGTPALVARQLQGSAAAWTPACALLAGLLPGIVAAALGPEGCMKKARAARKAMEEAAACCAANAAAPQQELPSSKRRRAPLTGDGEAVTEALAILQQDDSWPPLVALLRLRCHLAMYLE